MSDIQSGNFLEVFENENFILSQKQPNYVLKLLTRTIFNTEFNNFGEQSGLFKYLDNICSLHIVEGHSFIMLNNMRWELQSHVICRSIKIIYI